MNKAGVASSSNVGVYNDSVIMRRMAVAAAGICLLVGLGGCAVGMAMSGKPDPNLNAVYVGAHRADVELHLGYPNEVILGKDGTRQATYKFEVGNAPDVQRAGLHLAMDAMTLGAWEFVGTIMEASRGSKETLNIVYGPDNRVLDIMRVTDTSLKGKQAADIAGPTPEVNQKVGFRGGEQPLAEMKAEQREDSIREEWTRPKVEDQQGQFIGHGYGPSPFE